MKRRTTKGALHALLTNVIYTGKVDHKGTVYPGEHEAIIDQAVWEQVQKTLRRNGQSNGAPTKNKYGALLRGLLFCVPCGTAMIHSYTARQSKRWSGRLRDRAWQPIEPKHKL